MQTTSYWKIFPWDWGKDPQGWEGQWRLCVEEKKIAMGWDKVGDLTNLSMEKIKSRLFIYYREYRLPNYKARLTRDAEPLLNFKNIRNGDIVVANKGQSEIKRRLLFEVDFMSFCVQNERNSSEFAPGNMVRGWDPHATLPVKRPRLWRVRGDLNRFLCEYQKKQRARTLYGV